MKNPLIFVIVPVYNTEYYLKTCIESVLNQTYKNFELILVNDGSTDNSPQICDNFSTIDKRIKVIHKSNGGQSSARNIALNIASGDYITFLDSDDYWHTDYLYILLDLCLGQNADIAQCNHICGTDSVFPARNKNHRLKIFNNHSIFLKGHAKIIVWAKLYKRYLFDGIRMPEGRFFEDDFTTWKLYHKSAVIVVTNQFLYYYTQNKNSTMAIHFKYPHLDFIDAYKERIDYFKINNEKDLEDYSRGHLCKALLLTSNNPQLSFDQKRIVNSEFASNWQKIKFSRNVPFHIRLLFLIYSYTPKSALWAVNLLR